MFIVNPYDPCAVDTLSLSYVDMSWRPLDCVYTHPLLCFRIPRRHIFKYVIHCVVVRVWHTRRPRALNSENDSDGYAVVRVWHTQRLRAR